MLIPRRARRLAFLWLAESLASSPACHAARPAAAPPVPVVLPTAALAAAAVELTIPDRADSLDLDAVGRLVGNARVVMLGEPWHGDGGAIAHRAQIVRYLHEEKDFDGLVFEADFYALHEAWRQTCRTGDVRATMAQVYPFWTDTRAARPLWDYVAAQLRGGDTLHVAGVDTKMVGPRSRRELPRALLAR